MRIAQEAPRASTVTVMVTLAVWPWPSRAAHTTSGWTPKPWISAQVTGSGCPNGSTAIGRSARRRCAGCSHLPTMVGLGVEAAIATRTPIALHDWTLRPGAQVEVALPADHAAYVYVFDGAATIAGHTVGSGQLAVLGDGDALAMTTTPAGDGARLLVLAGVPLREPVVSYGPFVMNTRAEIMQAVRDYQAGRMGEIADATRHAR